MHHREGRLLPLMKTEPFFVHLRVAVKTTSFSFYEKLSKASALLHFINLSKLCCCHRVVASRRAFALKEIKTNNETFKPVKPIMLLDLFAECVDFKRSSPAPLIRHKI